MVAEPGRGYDAPWEWGGNGVDNLFKWFSLQEYLDEFFKRYQAGWTTFQAEVLVAGEGVNGPMVAKRWMGTSGAYSELMKQLTEKWYRDSMTARNDRAARDFEPQGDG